VLDKRLCLNDERTGKRKVKGILRESTQKRKQRLFQSMVKFPLTIRKNIVEFLFNKISEDPPRARVMRKFCWIAEAPHLIFLLILTNFGCSPYNGSLSQDSTFMKQAPAVISVTNPDFVVQPPVTIAWLPEPIQVFEDPRSNKLPIQETFRKAIAESLTARGYGFKQSTSTWKSGPSPVHKRGDIEPKDLILVKDWEWAGPSFGAGGILKELTLDNRSKKDLTDLKIRIDYLGTKGPKEGYGGPTSIFMIHDTLPAHSVKTFKDVNIGFRHPDERKERIRILNAKMITSDLLIGFTLAFDNTLTDQEISQNYGIAPGPSRETNSMNTYEKGTVLIDVADAESRTLIWRGALQAFASSDVQEEARRERIDNAVKILIDNFIDSTR
jgi:hypothetical protein